MFKVILILSLFIDGMAAGVYQDENQKLPGFDTMEQCEQVGKEAKQFVPPNAKAVIVCISDTEVKVVE